jgi:branched-chain amino acid transport system ATP-binding protein
MNLLEARGLSKSYGAFRVLKDIDLQVRRGASHAIIGPNGAGKTTLFRVLSGEVLAESGIIRYGEHDVTRLPGWRRVRMGIGRTFQVARIFRDMSVLENMLVAAEAFERNSSGMHLRLPASAGRVARERAREILADVGLHGKADASASSLSHGDKKRLELGMALVLRPDLLMLDEPMAGMSPPERAASLELIVRLKEVHGITLILTEHDMDVVFQLATDLTVLSYGEVVASGEPSSVRRSALVRELYLGKEAGGVGGR